MALKRGDKLPVFKTKDCWGKEISESTFLGKNVVLFFYPKNGTPVCTTEACGFRNSYDEFLQHNCEVVGISSDSNESHLEFARKHNLKYSLISDRDNYMRDLFGVPRSLIGLFPGRVTYLVDKEGVVRLVFNSQMNGNKHIEKTLEFIKKYLQ